MLPDYASPSVLDEKATAILKAAFDVFASYGFRRVSMEDIATAAGMSRAALYLHFRNKEDIFVHLVHTVYAEAAHNMAVALGQGGTPTEALQRAFAAKFGPSSRALMASPHGAELMSVKSTIAPDSIRACEAKLGHVLSDWLSREAQAGRVDLSATAGNADQMTHLMISAMDGVFSADAPPDSLMSRMDQLATVLGRAITAQ